jgi:PAS domain S-box-containing protein
MTNEPDIIKKLRQAEKLGTLHGQPQGSYEELESPDEPSENVADEIISFADDAVEKREAMEDGTIYKGTENELSWTNDKYRLIIENTSDLIALTTLKFNTTFTYVSPSYKKVLGYDPEDLIGKPGLDFIHPDDKRSFRPLLKKYVGAKTKGLLTRKDLDISETVEYHIIDKSGNWHYMEGTANFAGDEVLLISKDITERKWIEESSKIHARELEILNKIIISGNKSKDLQSLLVDVLDSVLDLMNFEGGGIYLVDETTRTAELVYHKGLPSDFIENTKREKIDVSPYEIIFIKGQPIFTENYSEIQPERSEKYGFLSIASIPLFAKDKIIGALNVASKNRHSFSDEERDILRAIGREIGTVISRMQMEKTLQDSEERYKTLVELSPDVIVVHIEGKIAFINSAGVNLMGAENLEQLLGKSIIDFIHPDYREKVTERLKEQKEGEKIPPIEEKLLRLDGTEIDVEAISTLVIYQGNPAVQVVIRDITERKQVEAKNNYLKKYNENILESNPNPIIIIKENQIEYVNKSFVSVFGKTKDNYISKDLKDAVPTKTISTCEEILKNHKRTIELEIKDNIFSVSSFIVKKAEEEEEERIGLILQDITERKNAEDEIKKKSEALAKANVNAAELVVELQTSHKKLEKKVDELERYKKVTVNRELKMVELKKRIKELEENNMNRK